MYFSRCSLVSQCNRCHQTVGRSVVQPLAALPMHGETKLRREGLRTRDGHLLEWFARHRSDLRIDVYSRAEPWPRVLYARWRGGSLPTALRLHSPQPLVIPPLRDRRRWWVDSQRHWSAPPDTQTMIIWNPIAGAMHVGNSTSSHVVFDLLDNWLAHERFGSIRPAIHQAYQKLFNVSAVVTANSEATAQLAEDYGRSDVHLIRNGCDPERFSQGVEPHEQFTVGYGGKIGHRLDVGLVEAAAARFSQWTFEFVGPILDRRVVRVLRRFKNLKFSGDVHYEQYPRRLAKWDVAWVPHRLGDGEVGGDVIKLYEYRAAGLPVVSTRIIGWRRALPGVVAVDRNDVVDALRHVAGSGAACSVARDSYVTPHAHTWSSKAREMMALLNIRAETG